METSKPKNRPLVDVGQPLREIATLESRAERLVAEYLRVWGLLDPQTIATLSRKWVRSACDAATSPQQEATATEIYRVVLRRASMEMRQWLDHLTSEVCSDSDDALPRGGLLAIELQATIDQCPAALLYKESLPASLLKQLASAARPVVPATCPTHMPTQSLSPISLSRCLSSWCRVASRICHQMRSTFSHQGGG